jgi:hypothetical protein
MKNTILALVNTYIARVSAEEGNRREWGFEVGRKYARIFWVCGPDSRSATLFVNLETGMAHRADSWKKPGIVTGDFARIATAPQVTHRAAPRPIGMML